MRKKYKKHSGHSDIAIRKLSKRQIAEIKKNGYTIVTLGGVKKKITPSNVIMGKEIEWYLRSDKKGKKKVAVRRPSSDRKRRSKQHRGDPRRQFEFGPR